MPSESREVAVIGGGGHAKVVISCLTAAGFRIAGVFDDNPSKIAQRILGYPVAGSTEDFAGLDITTAVIAVGSNRNRKRLAKTLTAEWATVRHPAAIIDPSASVDSGSVIFAGAVIQPEVAIGSHVIVNTAASIDHDCRIGDFTHIGPGARIAGGVTIGEEVLIGIGATVAPGVSIGDRVTLGAGAVVIKNVEDGATVVGIPARPLPGRTGA
jgi:acetyltransferase EpsM